MDSTPPKSTPSPAAGDLPPGPTYLKQADVALLQAALLDAFDLNGLEQVATLEFERSLAAIVPVRERTVTAVVHDLVQWASTDDSVGVQGLLRAALNRNAGNPALQSLAAQWAGVTFTTATPCPYPGMAPFAETDRDRFYGREPEIADAIQLLRLHPFLTVIGSSGSGKSSLVFAGIVPAMRKSSFFGQTGLAIRRLRPGKLPIDALAQALDCGDPSPAGILAAARTQAAAAPTLLVVDQFEETFTSADKGQAAAFQQLLVQLVAIPAHYLILTVRADFYPDLMNSPLWGEIRDHRLEVTALSGDGLRAAIAQPAAHVGVSVEPGLVELLVAEASGEPGALPFVQETLVLLWESISGHTLTLASYELLTAKDGGTGLSVAMARRADWVLKALQPDGQAIARRIFLRLVQFGEGRPDTRRQQIETDLRAATDDPAQFDAVLTQLIDHRLLTSDSAEAVPTRKIDIAHEALLSGWPALRLWVDGRRRMELRRRRLEAKADEWHEHGAGAAALLDEVELREAESWRSSDDAEELGYSDRLLGLLAASRASLEEERRLAEEAQQRELNQQRELTETQRLRSEEHKLAAIRQRKRTYLATAFALIALAFAAAAIWFGLESNTNRQRAETSRQHAETSRQNAENARSTAVAERATAQAATALEAKARQEAVEGYSRQLAARSLGLLETRLDQAALLSLEAGRVADTAEARQSLLAAVVTNPAYQYMLNGDGSAIADLQVHPTEELAAAGGRADGSIVLWDLNEGSIRQTLSGHPKLATSLAWNRDGSLLASGDSAGNINLWQITQDSAISHTLYQSPAPLADIYAVRALHFSPDGAYLAAGGCHTPGATGRRRCQEGEIRIWALPADAEASIVLTDHVDSITALAFSADGGLLAAAGCDLFDDEQGVCEQGSLSLLSAAGGWTKVGALQQPNMPGVIVSLAFHPLNPTLLAAGSADGSLQVWDTASGELLGVRRDADNMVSAVAFSPDGRWLASSQCERLVYSTLSNLRCTQARIEIWDGDSGRLANPYLSFTGHSDWPTVLSFTADSRRLLSGGRDGNLYVWDALAWPPLASPVWSAALTDPQPPAAQSLAYSPDSQVLAVALCLYAGSAGSHCTQGTIVLLEPGGSTPVAEISSPDVGVAKLAFSNASHTRQLAAAGCEQVDEEGECLRSAITLWTINRDWSYSAETLGYVDSAVTALTFAPHASRLAVGGDDGMVSVWDSATKELVFDGVYADSDQVNSVSFSSDGTLLAATGRDGAIVLLDAASGRPLDDPPLQVRGSDSPALAAFRPLTDSLMLASGGFFAHPVTLWDIKRSAGHIAANSHGLSDNSAGIADLSFDGDGSLLASANMAGEFTLWDVEQQRQVGPPLAAGTELQRFNMATVYDIELRPDGRQLATVLSNGDGAATWVLTWDTDPASWRRRACWRASRPDLSRSEREQFLGAGVESSVLCP